jgi:hypothetical protein
MLATKCNTSAVKVLENMEVMNTNLAPVVTKNNNMAATQATTDHQRVMVISLTM